MEVDRILLSMVQKATGLAIPMVDQGMRLRSVVKTSLAAFVDGVEQAVPHFVGEGGLRTPILGDMSQSADRLQNGRGVSNSVAISKTGSFTI